ncbi:unnamed protein product [Prorocentrum cordatum]|uniref:Uncharacterized protein n=1 Tax=Prorocentrum cordatum TaxID=2364126 RepID=A0ABN9XIB5_9DINO|nr:unnamed protein product [Polarella glacialis]
MWSVATGERLGVWQGREGAVPPRPAACSPDGSAVLMGSDSGASGIRLVATGECLCTLQGHEGREVFAAFSPDGLEASTTSGGGAARIWCVTAAGCLHAVERVMPFAASYSPVGQNALAPSPDGTSIIRSASGERLHQLQGTIASFTSRALGRLSGCLICSMLQFGCFEGTLLA